MAIRFTVTYYRRSWTDEEGVKHPLPSYHFVTMHVGSGINSAIWFENICALDQRIENLLTNGAEVVAINWLPDSRFCSPRDEYPKSLTL